MRDGNEILPGRKGVDILSTVTPLCGLAGFSELLLTRRTLLELAGLCLLYTSDAADEERLV